MMRQFESDQREPECPVDTQAMKWERRISEQLPVGLVAVGIDHTVLWCNNQFVSWSLIPDPIGKAFYDVLGKPPLLGPSYCPLGLGSRETTTTKMKLLHLDRILNMDVSPQYTSDGEFEVYLVEIRDVTENNKKERQLERLRDAGKELADLSQQEYSRRTHDERVLILKAKIAKFVREILHYQTIEIRLLSSAEPELLEPLLAIEMGEEAQQRKLYARQEGNGITGWVAFHGKPYKMDDKHEDAFFLQGSPGTESSITVPLLYHGKVIGTFNVESNQKNAFGEDDLLFLELFARDVAQAIHTLDLFSLEQKGSIYRSIETIYVETTEPLDGMLDDTLRILQSGMITEDDLLKHYLNLQELKWKIQRNFLAHGGEVAPETPPVPSKVDCRNHPRLKGKRILVVDANRGMAADVGQLLFFYGIYADHAPNGAAALTVLQNTQYDAILCNIALDDMSAFAFLMDARELVGVAYLPIIYMQAFGHDKGHVIVKSRQEGFLTLCIYKPLILHQLLDNLEKAMDEAATKNTPK